jgi:hypothetical protein
MKLVSSLVGWLLRSFIFETENGNDDRALLADPANYNLNGATNIYLPLNTVSHDTMAQSEIPRLSNSRTYSV